MAFLMKSLEASKESVVAPEEEKKVFTNFVR